MKKLIIFFFASFIAILVAVVQRLLMLKLRKVQGNLKFMTNPMMLSGIQLMIEVVKSSGLDFVSDSKEKGSILAQQGISALSYGENVAVFVEKVNETKNPSRSY